MLGGSKFPIAECGDGRISLEITGSRIVESHQREIGCLYRTNSPPRWVLVGSGSFVRPNYF